MDPIFKKLNYKDQARVFVLNAPPTFEANIANMSGLTDVRRAVTPEDTVTFAIGFATKQAEVDALADWVGPRLEGDAIFWIAYPKGSSKRYTCDFNRDQGWNALGRYGLEPVRQVAIDEDWSTLRFRNVAYIKTLTRKFGLLTEKNVPDNT